MPARSHLDLRTAQQLRGLLQRVTVLCCWRRGHADSVNSVAWQPFSGSLGTASADKTVCLWDARSGLPTLKLYGHAASCNCLAFSPEVRCCSCRPETQLHTVGFDLK